MLLLFWMGGRGGKGRARKGWAGGHVDTGVVWIKDGSCKNKFSVAITRHILLRELECLMGDHAEAYFGNSVLFGFHTSQTDTNLPELMEV